MKASIAGQRILVVEDEYFIAEVLRRDLESLGATIVGPASNVDTGLALVGSEEIDAAVLDINLQGETVFPVAAALQQRHVPFAFMTGYSEEVIPQAYSAAPRCRKPVDPRAIITALLSRGAWKN